MTISKENYLKRRHFFHCDEDLTNGLKAQAEIAPLLHKVLTAGQHVGGIDLEESLHNAVELALRRHPEALVDFLPYLKTKLRPLFLLTAVYTDKIDLVEKIIPHLDPEQSCALSLHTAAARNNWDIVRAVLPLAPDANFTIVLEHVMHHQNENIFALIYPFISPKHLNGVRHDSLDDNQWQQRLDWLDAQIQKQKIEREVKCNANVQKQRKM